MNISLVFYLLLISSRCFSLDWNDINIPPQHIPYIFNQYKSIKEKCIKYDCPFKDLAEQKSAKCWGYEDDCSKPHQYSNASCLGEHKGWVNSKSEQLTTFDAQADFGYIRKHRSTLTNICSSANESSSNLECNDHLLFCRGKNIHIDLTSLADRKSPVRYHMDVLEPGQIGGHCKLNKILLSQNLDMLSPLQSWGPELKNFAQTKESPENWQCDIWFEKPVIITKIDASVSLYHHFCDFFNLYASQHVNNDNPDAFSKDVQVLIWESYPYRSSFKDAWDVFTDHPLMTLADVAGKKLCFKDVVFPLLPRMIFGLFYNTPIIWGCEKSGLFHAFNRHVLHRLGVTSRDVLPPHSRGDGLVRVTLLARQTNHRRILNQQELVEALRTRKDIVLSVAQFEHGHDFRLQVKAMASTDVLIGMHGAGLTHMLFLPDWAAVFEMYNCGDEHCYKDLARLRGVDYFTWEKKEKLTADNENNHPDLGAHEKFTNYKFDVDEFLRIVDKAVRSVKMNELWQQYSGLPLNTKEEL